MDKFSLGVMVNESVNEAIEEVLSEKDLKENEKRAIKEVVYKLLGLAYTGKSAEISKIKEIIEEEANVH